MDVLKAGESSKHEQGGWNAAHHSGGNAAVHRIGGEESARQHHVAASHRADHLPSLSEEAREVDSVSKPGAAKKSGHGRSAVRSHSGAPTRTHTRRASRSHAGHSGSRHAGRGHESGRGHSSQQAGGPPGQRPQGQLRDWIQQAKQVLAQHGVDVSQISDADLNLMIQHESGGNPHAQNNWDSNARAGHPSRGIMQTIDSTFNRYSVDGHRDIWNPVDNIVAGVRYAISRYGSIANVPGVRNAHRGRRYVGY